MKCLMGEKDRRTSVCEEKETRENFTKWCLIEDQLTADMSATED